VTTIGPGPQSVESLKAPAHGPAKGLPAAGKADGLFLRSDSFGAGRLPTRDHTFVALPDAIALTRMSAPPPPKGAGHLDVVHRSQGHTWACGTNALFMAMQYHLGVGHVDFDKMDTAIRPTKQFGSLCGTAPGALSDYAKTLGLASTVHNHSTTNDIRRMVDQGLPVVLLGDRGSRWDAGLHYRVVTGYNSNVDALTTWTIQDALVETGKELRFSTEQLLDYWSNLRIVNVKLPYDHVIIGVAPPAKAQYLPHDNFGIRTKVVDGGMQVIGKMLKGAEHVLNEGKARQA
jgi:hypothetical protein